MGEFPPDQFLDKGLRPRAALLMRPPARSPDAAHPDLTQRQVLGQVRGRVLPRQVARFGIGPDPALHEGRETVARDLLAHAHMRCDDRSPPPHGCRHPPVLQPVRDWPGLGRRDPPRRGQRGTRIAPPHSAPHRGKDAVEPARSRHHVPWLEKEMARETARPDTFGPQRRLDLRIPHPRRRVVKPRPPDLHSPGLRDQRPQHVERPAPPQDQPRACRLQRAGKNRQPLAQPEPRCSAHRLHDLVVDKDRDDRPAPRHGGREGRMIREPQVAAQPEDDGPPVAHQAAASCMPAPARPCPRCGGQGPCPVFVVEKLTFTALRALLQAPRSAAQPPLGWCSAQSSSAARPSRCRSPSPRAAAARRNCHPPP